MNLPCPAILVITDRRQCARPLEHQAEALFRGGCRWLSLREKDLGPAERLFLLRRLAALGATYGATVGVHDDVVASCNCRLPLHLPAAADAAVVRAAIGADLLLGQSCHSQGEMDRATGVDYVTLGPVLASVSKPGYAPRLAHGDLTAIVTAARVPVVALGGVDLATLPSLTGTGFRGIAVMGAAMRANDPEAWFRAIAAAWRESSGQGESDANTI